MKKTEHQNRINETIDFIESNIEHDFSLDELSHVSGFSKFHFGRLFYQETGETVFQFISRLRLQKAASSLIRTQSPISEIAYMHGYNSPSVFSKNFKQFFKETATSYREKFRNSNLDKVNENSDKRVTSSTYYFCNQANTFRWKVNMEENNLIEIRNLPDIHVVYLRHVGPYQEDAQLFEGLFSQLFAWAEPRGILDHDFKTAIVYHDDVHVTEKSKLRTSVCITAPESMEVSGKIGKMSLKGGKYVVANFTLKADQFQKAWDWLMGEWFPQSAYEPDNKPCYEWYENEPDKGIFTVDICVPVKKSE